LQKCQLFYWYRVKQVVVSFSHQDVQAAELRDFQTKEQECQTLIHLLHSISYESLAKIYRESVAEGRPRSIPETLEALVQQETGNYITLGALGTAFIASDLPRVLLIDEIDKSDIDLPNDLLNLFEDGEFPIPELQRLEKAESEVRTLDRENGKQVDVCG
jgi:MoxR-like ATPase